MLCPPLETLRHFLDGQCADDWGHHIAHCAHCQSTLDHIADDPILRSWYKPFIDAAPDADVARFLAKVQADTPDVFHNTLTGDEYGNHPFLSAPTRAGDLGTLGPYHIERELGRGGMGVVFRAHDPSLNRTVAVKVLRPAADDAGTRSRLVREARALAKLTHSNIVQVYAIAETPTRLPYLVMEFVDGPNLADQLRANKAMSPRSASELIAAIAEGLHYAHSEGLIHRDVKPGNILLVSVPKLSDFGLVRNEQTTATASGILAGTPAYMSPEQIRDPNRVDARADIYGLGATLYECLTGDVPFHGSTSMVLRQVMDDEPRPPRRLNESVPRDLEVICLKALAKEPNRRYSTAAEFAADLRHFLAGEPISARPTGPAERILRWSQRKPLPAALAAALIVVAGLGISGIIWQWRIAVAEATEAKDQRKQAEENLRDAAAVVDRFLTRVSEDQLKDLPGFEPLRKQLLEDALKYYESFLTRPGAGPEMKVHTAKAAVRAARVMMVLRTPEEGVAAWDRAVSAWERCAGYPKQRDELVECQLNRAIALTKTHRLDEAQTAYESLLPEIKARAAANLDNTKYQSDVASVEAALANVHCVAGRHEVALPMFAAAIKQFQRILEKTPNDLDCLHRLGFCLNASAMMLPPEEALRLYDESRSSMDRAMAISKRAPGEIFLIGRIEHHRGIALNELNRKDEARSAMHSACTVLQQLVDGSPEIKDYRQSLASALHWLGSSQAIAKLPDAADTLTRAKIEYERLLTIEPGSEKYKAALKNIAMYQRSIESKKNREKRAGDDPKQ